MKIKIIACLSCYLVFVANNAASEQQSFAEKTNQNQEDYNKELVYYQSNTLPGKIISSPMHVSSSPLKDDDHLPVSDNNLMGDLEITVSKPNDVADLNVLLDHAYRAFKSGQTEAASSYYQEILAIDKNNSNAQFGLANIYHQNGQLNLAKALYSKILKKEPSNQRVLNNYLSLIGDQHKSEAILEFKKLEAISPNNSVIPAQIAMLYLKDKNYNKAIKYFKKAVSLNPSNTAYHYNIAICYDLDGNKQQAINHYQYLIEANYQGVKLPVSAEIINERITYLSARS